MVVPSSRTPHVFGSRLRDRLLMLLALVPEIHIRGAATVLNTTPSEVSKGVASLERAGIVASRLSAGSRLVSLNPRWYAAAELRPLIGRLAEGDAELQAYVTTQRTRPRRAGKPL